ncbi:MAG: carboxypeptidase-like regulatory domain-containing protein [Chitinophagales bacterium]|nr:TonB-dependent receptor [Bacteroidota bacterium]
MKHFYFSLFLFITFIYGSDAVFAQQIKVRGKIEDIQNKTGVPFANIYDSTKQIFSNSDGNGSFELNIPADNYTFQVSCVGYEQLLLPINLTKDTFLNIKLRQDIRLQEVEIQSNRVNKTATVNSSGTTSLTAIGIERLPAFLGEKDILKAVQLTPGIQSGQEGARGIFVRGGSPDQNLILFDQATIFNAAHIYGFLSVFTTEAIEKMDIYKSYIPVHYGSRLSSVLDITPNYGNTEKWKGDFSIGLITSKLHIEGPLKKDKTSMSFTIRDCHAGLFTMPISKIQYKKEENGNGGFSYYFYDINAAIQHQINQNQTLTWSFYTGNDFYKFNEAKSFPRTNTFYSEDSKKNLRWMNIANSIAWKIKLKKIDIENYYTFSFYKLFTKQDLFVVDRNFSRLSNQLQNTDYRNTSKINENSWQTNITQPIKNWHTFNYGIKLTQRGFTISNVHVTIKDSTDAIITRDTFIQPKVNSLDFYAYADYLFSWKEKVDIKVGFQLMLYAIHKTVKAYPQPRIELIVHPIKGMSIRASVLRNVQPMHLLTNNTGEIQNDVWVPASEKVEPETAWQYSFGIQYDHPKGYTASVDAYYKTMHHLTEYKYRTTYMLNTIPWDEQLLNSGNGTAYGVEFFMAKTTGQFTAWLKYNLSWSTRQFPEINEGKKYFYKYDRRHDFSVVLQYKLKKHFDFSISWTYGTGWRITTPNAKYASDYTIYDYDDANMPLVGNQNMVTQWNFKNDYVLPSYQHLDIGMNYVKQGKRVTHKLNLSVYNVYNHFNVFAVYRKSDVDVGGNKFKEFKQISLFPTTPSIGYSISFEKK